MTNKDIIKEVLESFENKKGWSEIVDGALRNKYMLEMDVKYGIEKALSLKDNQFKEKVEKLKEYVEEIYIGDISDEERENLQKEINKIFGFEPEETGEEK